MLAMYLRLFIALAGALGFAVLVGLFAVGILVALLVLLPVVFGGLWLAKKFGAVQVQTGTWRPPPQATVIEGEYREERARDEDRRIPRG
jgi:hypothetical protein